MDAMITDLHTQ